MLIDYIYQLGEQKIILKQINIWCDILLPSKQHQNIIQIKEICNLSGYQEVQFEFKIIFKMQQMESFLDDDHIWILISNVMVIHERHTLELCQPLCHYICIWT